MSAAPLHPWEWPEKPWTRIHIDYAGPFHGKMLLVVVDATSKWIEAHNYHDVYDIIRDHQQTSRDVWTEVLVLDNAPNFVGKEFETFMRKNGIVHVTSAVSSFFEWFRPSRLQVAAWTLSCSVSCSGTFTLHSPRLACQRVKSSTGGR